MLSRGERIRGASANIAAAPNDLEFSRFGLSVSKRVGPAVTRNLVKRRLRHALVEMNIAAGWDVVVTAKPQSSTMTYSALARSIENSLIEIGVQIERAEPFGSGVTE